MGSWAVMIALSVPGFGAATLATATVDLQAGKADEARALLTELLRSDGNNAEANNLLCRVEFTVQEFDAAAGHCERAVSLSPEVSRYHLWLGRALGERASRASFLSAFSLAKRTRAEFERAVELNPKDAEALTDLGEFYEEAPGAVGGGMDKARALAAKLDAVDMARGHDYRGSLAEHEKDLGTAEREYRACWLPRRSRELPRLRRLRLKCRRLSCSGSLRCCVSRCWRRGLLAVVQPVVWASWEASARTLPRASLVRDSRAVWPVVCWRVLVLRP